MQQETWGKHLILFQHYIFSVSSRSGQVSCLYMDSTCCYLIMYKVNVCTYYGTFVLLNFRPHLLNPLAILTGIIQYQEIIFHWKQIIHLCLSLSYLYISMEWHTFGKPWLLSAHNHSNLNPRRDDKTCGQIQMVIMHEQHPLLEVGKRTICNIILESQCF